MENNGHLYIVATPIGNLQDITLRAIEVLKDVDTIVCEDTRVTGNLLHHLGFKKTMLALNEFNEETIAYDVIGLLKDGQKVALVSDSGTPLISDPGFVLVRLARKRGFLSKNSAKKKKIFTHLGEIVQKDFNPTIIFYESPHRIVSTLLLMKDVLGDRETCIARELTKVYEEFRTEKISTIITEFEKKQPKGELTVLLSMK